MTGKSAHPTGFANRSIATIDGMLVRENEHDGVGILFAL